MKISQLEIDIIQLNAFKIQFWQFKATPSIEKVDYLLLIRP